MAYHDDLLEQARHLVHKERTKPKQASLRRAVSTAYYSLFHLLISEAVANWRGASQRDLLARAFDHGTMKAASNRVKNAPQFAFAGEDPEVVATLTVAETFAVLQEERHIADYDRSAFWTRVDAVTSVKLAEDAFTAWKSIRDEQIAQAYLVSLFVKKRD